jgi:hypothetical protein
MEVINKFFKKLKEILIFMSGLFLLLTPIALVSLLFCLPKFIFDLSYENYLKFLEVFIWPTTILIILYFFKKVATYLFFSMDEFNFFGAKGNLKNINDVVLEQVNKRFLEEKRERKRSRNMGKLNLEIRKKAEELLNKETQANTAQGKADESLKFAKEILNEWKKSTSENEKNMKELESENKRLKEIISGLSPTNTEVNVQQIVDENKTSDPIVDENNI